MLRLKKDMGAIVVVLLLGTTSQGQPALVHLDTAVAFKGQAVTGLTRNDFRIFDDDSEQSIVRFAGEEQPLDILLVFHASSQMVPTIKVIADAAHNGLQELHRGDRVAVMIFDAKSRVVLPLTQDMDAVERTLKNDVPGLVYNGHTTAAAAATRAAEFFLAESNNGRRRSVLHVFSVDVGVSTRAEETATEKYWGAAAVYNAVIVHPFVGQAVSTMSNLSPALTVGLKILEGTLTGTVRETGGELFTARDARAFRDALHRIRCRYSLWYEKPSRAPRFAPQAMIDVELAKDTKKRYPKAKVRTRSGYLLTR